MSTIKGQNLRVFVNTGTNTPLCVAMATSATFHIAAQLDDSSTKDSTGDWQEQEVVGLSWDASTDSLVVVATDATGKNTVDLMDLIINKTELTLTFDQTDPTSEKNRTPVSPTSAIKRSGKAFLVDFNISAPNRAKSTLQCKFQGNGPLS